MNKALSTFGLTKRQLQILFSLECYMVDQDAKAEERFLDKMNPLVATHAYKATWYDNYRHNVEEFLKEQNPKDQANIISTMPGIIQQWVIQASAASETEMWKYLVLLECTLFTPYFPMTEKDAKDKSYKGLTWDNDVRKKCLRAIAAWLGIDEKFIEQFEKRYSQAVKKMTNYTGKVLVAAGIGIAAVALAFLTAGSSLIALFAAEGLYGAAAISSGLAALGGGAVAAGGMGVAGGLAVLVGGGALLGAGVGGSLGLAFATTSPNSVLSESAKIWVVLKEIVMGVMNDTQQAQEILGSMVDQIAAMKKELAQLKLMQAENEAKIKNLQKSIDYLERLMKA